MVIGTWAQAEEPVKLQEMKKIFFYGSGYISLKWT